MPYRSVVKGCAVAGWVVVGLIALAAAADVMAATPADTQAAAEGTIAPSSVNGPRVAYEYHVLAGEMAIERGKADIAAREYVAAVRYSNDPVLAERATRIAMYADKPRLAYRAAQVWAQARQHALDAQRAVTRLAFIAGDGAHLADDASALVAAAASPEVGYRLLAGVLGDRPKQADLALATLKKLTESDAKSAAAEYARGIVALRYDRIETASKAAAASTRLDRQWADSALLQAAIWVRQGDVKQAQKRIAGLSGSTDKRAQYHEQLAHLLIKGGATRAARDEFARAAALDPADGDARFGAGVLSLELGESRHAQTQFRALYKAGEHKDDAAFYLGEIAQSHNQYAQAQKWYQRVDNGGHAFTSQLRAADMIYQQGDLAAARARLTRLRQSFPDMGAQISATEGGLLVESGKSDQALALYNHALKAAPHNADLLYGRSLVYERMGRIVPAEADLRAMLKHDDRDPRALNALGYMLTNHSSDYARAAGYIHKALAADPGDPAILDSMGWVQYKLGKLDKARHNLEQAYKGSSDPEVAAHLGEVRWRQGDHAAARKVWQHAHAKHPHNAVLNQTLKRFGL